MWHPHNLIHCYDSNLLSWITVFLCVLVSIAYSRIAYIWYKTAKSASQETKTLWVWLILIFLFCLFCGYGYTIISLFWPKTAIITRVIGLLILTIVSFLFLSSSSRKQFLVSSENEKIGKILKSKIKEKSVDDILLKIDNLIKNERK